MIQLNHGRPQPLQYAVKAAFLASLYADYLGALGIPGFNCGPYWIISEFKRREEPRSSDPPISAQRAPPAASPTRRRRRGAFLACLFFKTSCSSSSALV